MPLNRRLAHDTRVRYSCSQQPTKRSSPPERYVMMSKSRPRLALCVFAAIVLSLIAAAPASAASTSSALAQVKGATAAFHDPAAARAAGYIPTQDCVAVPGLGVMGQHWVNPGLFTADPSSLDPAHPQALLYVPTANGVRLVAVEYIVFAPGQQPSTNPEQVDPNGPALFGQHFNGLMAGHFPGMPTHWDMHVWIWAHNPSGVFAQFNSSAAISC